MCEFWDTISNIYFNNDRVTVRLNSGNVINVTETGKELSFLRDTVLISHKETFYEKSFNTYPHLICLSCNLTARPFVRKKGDTIMAYTGVCDFRR